MASTSTTPAMGTQLNHVVSEKLAQGNFLLWKAQVLPAIRGAQLMGFLDGTADAPAETIEVTVKDSKPETKTNPAYATRVTQDQQVLGYLLNSMTREVLGQMTSCTSTSTKSKAVQI